jgi:phosphate starvation-inducible PhoH-like protein
MENSITIHFKNNKLLPTLYGEKNANITYIEKKLNTVIASRGNFLAVSGQDNEVTVTATLLEYLYTLLEQGITAIGQVEINQALERINSNTYKSGSQNVSQSKYVLKTRKKNIFAYTENQLKYLETLHEKDVSFGIGVAGTGKTYLAVAMAVSMFIEKKVDKIILTRPVVEAGEKLGFLPGDVREKVDPYLQPLYDSLYEMLPAENVERYIATKEIQIAPLAFMRGRTLSRAFVILDEGQNATITQMKMFLTRLGIGSKMAITGDLSQIDLPSPAQSGLIDAIEKLKHLKEIGIVRFNNTDIVRHALIGKIIEAYEENH